MALLVFLGIVVDWATETPPAEFFSRYGWALAGMGFVILVIRPVTALLSRGLTSISFVPSLTALVRWRSYRYVLRQSLSFFQNDFAGRIAQKVLQSGPALRESVVNVVEGIFTLVIYLVGTVALFVGLDAWLVLPVALWAVAYGVTIYWMVPPVRAKSEAMAEANSGLSGRIVDSYTNIQAVKLFAHATREEDFAREGFVRHVAAFRDLRRRDHDDDGTLNVINSVLIFATAALSIWLWSVGEISVGAIAMANALVIRLNQMSRLDSPHHHLAVRERRDARERHRDDQPAAGDRRPAGRDAAAGDRGRHPLRGCPLPLRSRGRRHRSGLSLSMTPGEKVGLVGRSGAGKSTLVNLLLRFYDLESGRILIDGQDVATVTQESLRAVIGVVTQDTSLLHRSVRDNIRYGQPLATEDEIATAAAMAQADGFIPGLEDWRERTRLRRPCRRARGKALRRPAPARRHRPPHPQGCADPRPRRGDERARLRRSRRRSRSSSTA